MEISVLLHNIRSAHNVGSIFRTCDAAGVSRVYLTGYTPAPTDRFGRAQKDIAKTALGAEKMLSWERRSSPATVISELRAHGWNVVGVEQDKRAVDYRTFSAGRKPKKPTLLIFGNEVKGIPFALRKQCDMLVQIPMHGKKESLNVSVAAGIILFST